MAKYMVRYERDEEGWWVGRVRGVKGCHTQGRSIDQVRTRIREALALFVDNADKAELVDDIDVPPSVKKTLALAKKIRLRAAAEQKKAATLIRELAIDLVNKKHLSVRDAGKVLKVSHQRVQQLLDKN